MLDHLSWKKSNAFSVQESCSRSLISKTKEKKKVLKVTIIFIFLSGFQRSNRLTFCQTDDDDETKGMKDFCHCYSVSHDGSPVDKSTKRLSKKVPHQRVAILQTYPETSQWKKNKNNWRVCTSHFSLISKFANLHQSCSWDAGIVFENR